MLVKNIISNLIINVLAIVFLNASRSNISVVSALITKKKFTKISTYSVENALMTVKCQKDLYANLTQELLRNCFKIWNLNDLEINLNWRNITHLQPNTFQNYTSLRILNLYHNRLTTLGNSTFKGLANLVCVFLKFFLNPVFLDYYPETSV